MSSKDSLGDRMKRYEDVPRGMLIPRVPVIIRVDGKAFHTLTKSMEKPVDERMQASMHATAVHLCTNIQGAQMAYVQSDEISVLVTDYASRESQGWFEYDHQKMVSVSASLATVAFSRAFWSYFPERDGDMPTFDSRAWNVPLHETNNYFVWRQQDATRNSIQSLARSHFSAKKLHGVSNIDALDMLSKEKGVNWDECPVVQKHGACVVKRSAQFYGQSPDGQVSYERSRWTVDDNIPRFMLDTEYVNRLARPPVPVESVVTAA